MKSKIKILVTGGAGNIGTNLCNELRSREHHVIAADLYNTERDDYIRCDVRNYRQVQHVFDELGPFDFVYHLAAIIWYMDMIESVIIQVHLLCFHYYYYQSLHYFTKKKRY